MRESFFFSSPILVLLCALFAPTTINAAAQTASVEPDFSVIGRVVPALAEGQSATLLPTGRWLLLGGKDRNGKTLRDASVFDPRSGMINVLPSALTQARAFHTATVLPDGSVLVVGGEDDAGKPLSIVERYRSVTNRFEVLGDLGLAPRAHHSATLLMDGKLLLVGGVNDKATVLDDAELLDTASFVVERFNARLEQARFDQLSALLPSDYVLLWGGNGADRKTLATGELYDRGGRSFQSLDANPAALPNAYPTIAPEVRATLPSADSADVGVDARIVVRFSKPLRPETLTPDVFTLIGPTGTTALEVVPAEAGLLAFLTPLQQLFPGARYTLITQGGADDEGRALPLSTMSFETAAIKQNGVDSGGASGISASAATGLLPKPMDVSKKPIGFTPDDENEDWLPGAHNYKGNWRSERPHLALRSKPAWAEWRRLGEPATYFVKPHRVGLIKNDHLAALAPAGQTSVAGQVLRLNGRPLAGVTLSIGNTKILSDANGEFVLRNVPAGVQVLAIDGSSAGTKDRTYGYFEYQMPIEAGQVNALDFPIWMPKLDQAHAVKISSPTTRDLVIAHPSLPGFELTIPHGTVIRDAYGKIATEISITPIPVDQTPFPMPHANVPLFFTLQPGGAVLQGIDGKPKAATLRYPNYTTQPHGAGIEFFGYEARGRGWYIYDMGHVSGDGKEVLPEHQFALYKFTAASIHGPGIGGTPPPSGPHGCTDGDPVSCAEGLFLETHTDLTLRDTHSAAFTRTYRQNDANQRAFGVGASDNFDLYLKFLNWVFPADTSDEADLYLDSGAKVRFLPTNNNPSLVTGTYESLEPGEFYKAKLQRDWNTDYFIITLKDGRRFGFSYQQSYLLWSEDRAGNRITITRNINFGIDRLTTPTGRWMQFSYNAPGCTTCIAQITDHTGRIVRYAYDSSGRLIQVTDPEGNTTQYTYEATTHRMLTIKDPVQVAAGSPLFKVTNEYYTNTGNPNLDGRVKKQTYADGTTTQFAYTLDANGNTTQTEVTHARGDIRRIEYTAPGANAVSWMIRQETQALGAPEQQVTQYDWDLATNLLNSKTDSLGRKTAYAYDARGNTTTITSLKDTAQAISSTYVYEPTCNLITTITDPLNQTTSFTLSADKKNITRITDPLGHAVDMTYNGAGQLQTATRHTGTRDLTTTNTYDPSAGDLIATTDPLGRQTTFVNDALGRPSRTLDAQGNLTRTDYDKLDRVKATTDARGKSVAYAYNPIGQLTQFTDTQGHATLFTYDAARHRLLTKTDALNQVESYSYDAEGNLTALTDRNGQVSGFTYDQLNRKISAGFGATPSNPTAYQRTVAYTWDAGNRLTQALDSSTGAITRSYDDLNRLVSEATPQGGVSYGYDNASRRTSMTVAGQNPISYSVDNASRLAQITQDSSTTTFTYDNANRRTQLLLPNGVETDYSYDDADQLVSLTYQKGPIVLGDLSYTYDASGNRINIGGSFATTNLPMPASGSYDGNNRLTAWNAAPLSYDANGNLISDSVHSYTWDSVNRLTAMDGTNSFQYDAFGRRASKTINSTQTGYLYDGPNFVQELTGSTPNANLIAGQGYDEFYARATAAGIRYPLTDALGSIVALTDESGNLVATYAYSPYGETTTSGAADTNSQQYTGRENDNTGVYYYRARYYDPQLKRFIAQDPIGLNGGINWYAYVDNNPLLWTDPTGTIILPPVKWPWNNWYGNWCGPGGGGPTISGFDCACKHHDQCYDSCGSRAGNRWIPGLKGCVTKCDIELFSHPVRNDCDGCKK